MVTTASETPYSAIQDGGKEEKNKYAADLEAGGLGDPTSEEALKMVQQYTFREKIVDKIAIFEGTSFFREVPAFVPSFEDDRASGVGSSDLS